MTDKTAGRTLAESIPDTYRSQKDDIKFYPDFDLMSEPKKNEQIQNTEKFDEKLIIEEYTDYSKHMDDTLSSKEQAQAIAHEIVKENEIEKTVKAVVKMVNDSGYNISDRTIQNLRSTLNNGQTNFSALKEAWQDKLNAEKQQTANLNPNKDYEKSKEHNFEMSM